MSTTRTIISVHAISNGRLIQHIPTLSPLPAVGEILRIEHETEEDGLITVDRRTGRVVAVDEQARTYDLLVNGDQA